MQTLDIQHAVLLIVATVASVVAVIAVISWAISYPSGWHALAERYRTDRRFPAHQRRGESARMRALIRYKGILDFGLDAEGIYMSVMIPIPNHPRLFIPWTEIEVTEPGAWHITQKFLLGPDKIPLRGPWPSLAQFLLEPRGGMDAVGNAAATGTISSSF